MKERKKKDRKRAEQNLKEGVCDRHMERRDGGESVYGGSDRDTQRK